MLHDISVLKYAYLECRVNVCAEEFRLAQIIVNSMRVSTREHVQQIKPTHDLSMQRGQKSLRETRDGTVAAAAAAAAVAARQW